jgi:hypothetical protein
VSSIVGDSDIAKSSQMSGGNIANKCNNVLIMGLWRFFGRI